MWHFKCTEQIWFGLLKFIQGEEMQFINYSKWMFFLMKQNDFTSFGSEVISIWKAKRARILEHPLDSEVWKPEMVEQDLEILG